MGFKQKGQRGDHNQVIAHICNIHTNEYGLHSQRKKKLMCFGL